MASLRQRAAAKLKLMELADIEESGESLPAPQPGIQSDFYQSEADIVFFGGAAGGGKTFGLLLDFAKPEYLATPGYNAVIFRRTSPDITNEGGIWDTSNELYPGIGGKSNATRLSWTFPPTMARIRFAQLQHQKTVYSWKSSQIARIGFEELTEFYESQFFYMISRNRSSCGIKPQIRATMNPDSDSWVAKFIDWWWDSNTGEAIHERSGVIRYFYRFDNTTHWGETKQEIMDKFGDDITSVAERINAATLDIGGTPIKPEDLIKSFTFIKADVYDNPELLKANPEYLSNLMALHPVERARLLGGNWKARFDSGTIFNREWFDVVDNAPIGQCVRFWDIAATAQEMAKSSSYYTAGVKMSKSSGCYFVLDAIAEQKGAGAVEALIIGVARQDGKKVKIRWEQEGGSAGILWCENLKDRLVQLGFDADYIKPMGDKVSRSIPYATDAVDGKVSLLRGTWNETYLNSLQHFDGTPAPLINDLTDASTGAHTFLSTFAFQKLPNVKKQENSPAQLRKVF